jgi:hypothetical protein
MVDEKDAEAYVQKVKNQLKANGISLQRILTRNDNLKMEDIGDAIVEYRKTRPGIPMPLYLVMMRNSLRSNYYPELTSGEFTRRFILPHLEEDEKPWFMHMMTEMKFYFPKRDQLISLLKKYFNIVEIKESSGPGYWDTSAIYVLKLKSG